MKRFIKAHSNQIRIVAAALAVLILLSFGIIGGILAKYRTDNTKTEQGRVAAWAPAAQIASVTSQVAPGQIGSYSIAVQNLSEVSTDYDIRVTFSVATDAVTKLRLAAASAPETIVEELDVSSAALDYVFPNVGTMTAQDATGQNWLLYVVSSSDASLNAPNGLDYNNSVISTASAVAPFRVSVHFKQAD